MEEEQDLTGHVGPSSYKWEVLQSFSDCMLGSLKIYLQSQFLKNFDENILSE